MGVATAFRRVQADRRVSQALGSLHRIRPRGRAPRRRWLWLLGFAVGLAVALALVWSPRRER